MNNHRFASFLAGIALAVSTTVNWATPIVVNNPSFDNPGLNDGDAVGTANEPAFFAAHAWHATPATTQMGLLNWTSATYPGATDTTPTSHVEGEVGGPGVPDGSSVTFAYCGGCPFTGSLWQKTSAQFERGTYTIGVYAGLPNDGTPFSFPDARIRLYAGTDVTSGTLLKEMSITNIPTAGTFRHNTLTFGTNDANWATLFAANQLQPLTVSLYAAINGRQEVDWDFVTFDFVPEPACGALVGLASLLFLRRRK